MRAVVLAVLLVALPVLGGPNARDAPLLTDAAIQDLAVAATSGSILAGTLDPGDKVLDRDAVVWHLWDRSGTQIWAQPGDRADCTSRLQDDCKSPVLAVAVSGDGRRAVILTAVESSSLQSDANQTLVVLATANQGIILRQTIAHDAIDVAIARDGSVFAILATDASAASDDGHVYAYNWPAAGATYLGTPRVAQALGAAATSLALSPDGLELAVGGARYWHFAGTTGSGATTTAATPVVTALAVNADHRTAVGHSNGVVSLYDPSGSNKAAVFGRQIGTSSITSMAFSGSLYVAGDAGGRIHVFRATPTASEPAAVVLSHTVGTGAVRDLHLSDDGRYLTLRMGRNVHFLTFDGTNVASGWTDTLPADPVALSADAKADLIAVAHGTNVRIYDALHQVTISAAKATVPPGATRDLTVAVENTGNRAETVTLQPGSYAGWTVALSKASLTLAPAERATVTASVTVPAQWPPGASGFWVNHTLASGTGNARLLVDVPTVTQVSLSAVGNAYTRGIEPGASTAYTLEVHNEGNTPVTTDVLPSKPGVGWEVRADPGTLSLAAGETKEVSILLTAPTGLADGTSISFPVRLGASAAEVTLTATVGAVFEVGIKGPAGLLVGAGNETTFDVTVTNQGNAPDSINVGLRPIPLGWTLVFANGQTEAAVVDLDPGASGTVGLVLAVPADSVGFTQLVTVRGTSAADPTKMADTDVFVTVTEGGVACPSGQEFKEGRCKDTPLPAALVLVALGLVAWRRRKAT